MKLINKTWLVILSLPCAVASAAPDAPAQLADVTSKNLAALSTALTAHQNSANGIANNRKAHIVSIYRLSIDGRQESNREVSILKDTGGADILKVYATLCDHGDSAALASGQADAEEAAAKADVTAAYTPLAIATDKLDRSAKTLAGLGKEQSIQDRLTFLKQFAKDVGEESAKLEKAAATKKAAADQQLDKVVDAVSSTVPKKQ